MIGNARSTVYWRKTYKVEAVRLTEENAMQIADFMGADYWPASTNFGPEKHAYIQYMAEKAFIGDWIVMIGTRWEFYVHEDFLQKFRTHSEQETQDEKYARVFQLVTSAMHKQDAATYHGDSTGMGLVAIEITKRILEEL